MIPATYGCRDRDVGAGDERGAGVRHNPGYDFNDDILPIGAQYWQALVESQSPKR